LIAIFDGLLIQRLVDPERTPSAEDALGAVLGAFSLLAPRADPAARGT
jgi:hypothetical protein